jgi:hypothetical protein
VSENSKAVRSVGRLLAEWIALRAELAEMERAEHPDITDRHGRVWSWVSKNLYRHCGIAAPANMINQFGLPTQQMLDNPNYGELCAICLAGRERHVPACRPEWGTCSHVMHQAPDGGE